MTKSEKAPETKLDKAIDKAKELGGVKPQTAEVLKEVKKEPAPSVGASKAEIQDINVELPDPTAQKRQEVKESAVEVVEPPKIINGEIVFSQNYVQLVKNQIAKDLNQDEFAMYLMMAKRFRLDPLARQITPVVFSKDDPNRRRVSYVTTIDGLRLVAHRTNEFAGIDEPVFTYQGNQVTHCSIIVYKFVQNQRVGFSAKVKFGEYTTGMNLWKQKPETMIAKVAEAHALRKAFPQELSGIYTSDEMEASEPAKPKITMASEGQKNMIYSLLTVKGKTEEDLHDYIKRAWNLKSMKELTTPMANRVINTLQKMPDPTPIEETQDSDDGFENMANQALAGGEAMPSVDEIDAGIEKMRGEK